MNKIKIWVLIGLLLFVTLSIIVDYIKPCYKLDYEFKDNIEIVVSRYNENLQFLFEPPFSTYKKITCYNKGPLEPSSGYPDNCTVIHLSNIGRCDHTYLYHIIKNYKKLSDATVFLPASCVSMDYKRTVTYDIMYNVQKLKTVLTHKANDDYMKTFDNFYMDYWGAKDPSNNQLNPESKLLPSPIRPFGQWYKHNFPELEGKPIRYACWYGIFSVSKKDILKNPIEKYQRLISYLDHHSNPEVGHYMERSWGALFFQGENDTI